MASAGSYRGLRVLHLLAGLVATPALLVYSLTALQLTLPPLGPRTDDVQRTLQLEAHLANANASPQARLAALRRQGVDGALTHAAYGPGGELSLTLVAGAARHEVAIDGQGRARVSTERGGLLARFRNLHFVSARHGGADGLGLWARLALVTGIALLCLVVTGLLLWLRRPAERRLGAALLVGNLLWGALAVAALITQGAP